MKTFALKWVWFLIVLALLFGCSNQNTAQVAVSSDTPEPPLVTTPTETKYLPTATPTPTRTFEPTRTPRFTPIPPYPLKKIIFNYASIGSHSSFDSFYRDYFWSDLVLYTDGQIIIPGRQTQQKTMSKDEIDYFFARLESLGFYSLETNQKHDPTDKLYSFGKDQYGRVYDGITYCIFMKGDRPRDLCARDPFREFLVPQMKNILEFLDYYRPGGMSLYYPDRILVDVQAGRSEYLEDISVAAISWPDHLPSLETKNEKIMYFQGDDAKEIFELFGHSKGMKVFIQNGVEYTLYFDIVLPHEEITNE